MFASSPFASIPFASRPEDGIPVITGDIAITLPSLVFNGVSIRSIDFKVRLGETAFDVSLGETAFDVSLGETAFTIEHP